MIDQNLNKKVLKEDTTTPNAPNIATTDENLSVDVMFQQSKLPSLGRQIFSVVPINGPTGAIFNITPQSGLAEITTILCEADVSGSLNNKYWLLSSPTTDYYIWYNVNSGGTDPTIAGKTGIEVAVATDADADTVAAATQVAIDAEDDFGATVTDATVTVTNADDGEVTHATDGNTNWGYAWAVTQQGTGVVEITEIACEADIAGSLSGKYFLINSPSTNYYVWMQTGEREVNTLTASSASDTDMTGTKEVNTLTASDASDTDMTGRKRISTLQIQGTAAQLDGMVGAKQKDTFTVDGAASLDKTGAKEVNTLTCGTAAQIDMTGAKEVNTIIAEADHYASLDGKDFPFYALDSNNGTLKQYYCYFDVANDGNPPDPNRLGTPIKVSIDYNATAIAVATAIRAAITASDAEVTVSGSGATVILTGNFWGEAESITGGNTGWDNFERTVTGIDITAGEYFTFSTGLSGSEVNYYAWFNATGGAAANTAPSLDPEVVDATGIEVQHAFNADANAMGTALRAALESVVGTTGNGETVITGATTDAIITNVDWGVGVASGDEISDAAFTAIRTVTGIDITAGNYIDFTSGIDGEQTDYRVWFSVTGGSNSGEAPSIAPDDGGKTLIKVEVDINDINNDVGALLRTAVAVSGVTITGSNNTCTIENNDWGLGTTASDGDLNGVGAWAVNEDQAGIAITPSKYFTFTVGITNPINYYVWYSASNGTTAGQAPSSDPEVVGATGVKVEHLINANAINLADATYDALIANGVDTYATITDPNSMSTNVVITDLEYGVGVAPTKTWTVNFNVTTTAGVDITAGDYLTFYTGLNGSENSYYVWFNATGGTATNNAPSTDPEVADHIGIEVQHAFDADANTMGAAIRAAIESVVGQTGDGSTTISGATTNTIITNTEYGEGVIATVGSAPTNFSIARTATGVDITAGDYLIFYTGLSGSPKKYYVWFNATGGTATDNAPSTDPAVAAATGIEVQHAFDADANTMGAAIRAAIESVVGVTGNSEAVITGATTDTIITDALIGIGTPAETGSAPTNFSVDETNVGTEESTDPAISGRTGIMASFDNDSNAATVAVAVGAAIDAVDDFDAAVDTLTVTVTNVNIGVVADAADGDTGWTSAWTVTQQGAGVVEISTIICKGDISNSLNNKYWTLSSPSTDYYVWYSVNGLGSLQPIAGKTAIKVSINTNATAAEVAAATATAINTLSDFVATSTLATVTVTNVNIGVVTDLADGNTGWSSAWTITIAGALNTNEFKLVRSNVEVENSTAIKTGITQEAIQDLRSQHGKSAEKIIGMMLRALANDAENTKTMSFLSTYAKVSTTLALTNSKNAETNLFEITHKVQELVLQMNKINIRTYDASVVLPYKVMASIMSLSQYIQGEDKEERGLFIAQINRTKYYTNPVSTSLTAYVVLKDIDNPSKSSAIFSPYVSQIIEAQDPNSGSVSYHIFNRYAITISPLHVSGNEMIYSFDITL
jgi:phage tail sheath gpL-like